MIEPGDMTDQAEGTAPVDGLGGLAGFEDGFSALFAESGLFDHVAVSCRYSCHHSVLRRAPALRPRTGDGSARQPQPVRRAGFQAGGAGGGGPGFRGIGRSAAFRVALPRIGAPDTRSSGDLAPAAAYFPSLAWRDPIL